MLNSANFGVAQSRKRVFIVGFLGERCPGEILSFTEANGTPLIQSIPGTQGNRVYSSEGLSCTLTSGAGGFGGKSGLYEVGLPIKVNTKTGYQTANPGDSIDLAYPTLNSRRGRVGKDIAHTVTPGNTQGLFFIDMNENPKLTEVARCITARHDSGISKRKGEHSGVFMEEPRAILTPDKEKVRQQGRRMKEPDGTARWATKAEIKRTYKHLAFTPDKWRKQASKGQTPTTEDGQPLPQGIVVGCTGAKKNNTRGKPATQCSDESHTTDSSRKGRFCGSIQTEYHQSHRKLWKHRGKR